MKNNVNYSEVILKLKIENMHYGMAMNLTNDWLERSKYYRRICINNEIIRCIKAGELGPTLDEIFNK